MLTRKEMALVANRAEVYRNPDECAWLDITCPAVVFPSRSMFPALELSKANQLHYGCPALVVAVSRLGWWQRVTAGRAAQAFHDIANAYHKRNGYLHDLAHHPLDVALYFRTLAEVGAVTIIEGIGGGQT